MSYEFRGQQWDMDSPPACAPRDPECFAFVTFLWNLRVVRNYNRSRAIDLAVCKENARLNRQDDLYCQQDAPIPAPTRQQVDAAGGALVTGTGETLDQFIERLIRTYNPARLQPQIEFIGARPEGYIPPPETYAGYGAPTHEDVASPATTPPRQRVAQRRQEAQPPSATSPPVTTSPPAGEGTNGQTPGAGFKLPGLDIAWPANIPNWVYVALAGAGLWAFTGRQG